MMSAVSTFRLMVPKSACKSYLSRCSWRPSIGIDPASQISAHPVAHSHTGIRGMAKMQRIEADLVTRPTITTIAILDEEC